jgi:hypothetical protein
MPMPEHFKYDTRVRERLLRKGQLSESEVDQHLGTLADVASNAADVELKQPALQTEAERAENSVIVRPAPPRPLSVAPISLEDEDDEDEEDEKPIAPRSIRVEKVEKLEAEPAKPAAAVADEDDEDEDDEDDEDEDDEDDEDEDGGDGGEGEEEVKAPGGSGDEA